MYRIIEVLALVLAAFTLAPALAHAAELPGKMRLDRETYAAVQPIYHPGFTIVGLAEPATLLALVALLLLTPGGTAPFRLYAGSLLALAAMHAVYWTVTHPVNRFWLEGRPLSGAGARFFGVDAGKQSAHDTGATAGWQRLRNRWEYSHAWRAALAALALALLALGVAW